MFVTFGSLRPSSTAENSPPKILAPKQQAKMSILVPEFLVLHGHICIESMIGVEPNFPLLRLFFGQKGLLTVVKKASEVSQAPHGLYPF